MKACTTIPHVHLNALKRLGNNQNIKLISIKETFSVFIPNTIYLFFPNGFFHGHAPYQNYERFPSNENYNFRMGILFYFTFSSGFLFFRFFILVCILIHFGLARTKLKFFDYFFKHTAMMLALNKYWRNFSALCLKFYIIFYISINY